MIKGLIYIMSLGIMILCFWKGCKIWKEDNKVAGIATIFLSLLVLILLVLLIMIS